VPFLPHWGHRDDGVEAAEPDPGSKASGTL
jgi:hypothetical protein